MEPPRNGVSLDTLQEETPEMEPLYAGPMLNIRGGDFLGRRALYVTGRHKRLVKSHIQVWFAGDDRPINGHLSDTVAPCVPELEHCKLKIHLHDVHQVPIHVYGSETIIELWVERGDNTTAELEFTSYRKGFTCRCYT